MKSPSNPEQTNEQTNSSLSNEQADRLLKLADAAWNEFDTRRSYEWKVNLAIWPAFVIFSGFVWQKEGLNTTEQIVAQIFVVAMGAAYTFWSYGHYKRNHEDQKTAAFYRHLIEKSVYTGYNRFQRGAKRKDEVSFSDYVKGWSRGPQLFITWLLVSLAFFTTITGGAWWCKCKQSSVQGSSIEEARANIWKSVDLVLDAYWKLEE